MTRSPVARLRDPRSGAFVPALVPASGRQDTGRRRNQRGVTTAEYAVVTAAGCGFGGVLIKLLTSDWGQGLLKKIFDFFLSLIGLG